MKEVGSAIAYLDNDVVLNLQQLLGNVERKTVEAKPFVFLAKP